MPWESFWYYPNAWKPITLQHSWDIPTSPHHHSGCRCPGPKQAPCHQQPPYWYDCDYIMHEHITQQAYCLTIIKQTTGYRADSRLALSEWETPSQSNGISHWMGTNLESAVRLGLREARGLQAVGSLFISWFLGYLWLLFSRSHNIIGMGLALLTLSYDKIAVN